MLIALALMLLLVIGVAYSEDTDKVIAALQEIDAGMRSEPAYASDMLASIEILGVGYTRPRLPATRASQVRTPEPLVVVGTLLAVCPF
jgi:hypothetical protein